MPRDQACRQAVGRGLRLLYPRQKHFFFVRFDLLPDLD